MPQSARGQAHITDAMLTLEKRILLHLLRFNTRKDDFEVPMDVSQEGVGKLFGVRQSSVSRVLSKMMRTGLLTERSAYVSGSKQKRRVYFLTHKGAQYALEARRNLEGMTVTLIIDSEHREVELKRVNEHLKAPLDMFDIIKSIGPRGEIDVSALVRTEPRETRSQVIFGDPIPKGRAFVGRARELDSLRKYLASKTIRVVLVHGVAGIGKTALVAKLIEELEGQDVLYLRLREWSTLSSIVGSFGTFLGKLGKRNLASVLREGGKEGPMDLKAVMGVLQSELRDMPVVLVFDDFHAAGQVILPFFTELIEVLSSTRAHAVILTRFIHPFYDRRHVVLKGVVKEMRLEGLSRKECEEVLKEKQLDKGTVARVHKATGGHPLSLELIGILGDLKEVDKFLFEEIYSTLTAGEKTVLQLASVMRYPVPQQVLLNAGDSETIDILVRKALIREVGDGFEIQDLLRVFFQNRTPPGQLRDSHAIAMNYYSLMSDARSVLESAYHEFRSGRRAEAIDMLVSQADTFVREGLSEDLISLIDGFGSDVPKESYKAAFELREKVANVWGTWDNNLEAVFDIRLLHAILGMEIKHPTMEMRTSFLGSSAEDTEDTLKDLKGSMDILKRVGDAHGLGHTAYSIAWVRWIRGELSLARKEAARLIEMGPDDELKARAMLLLGGIGLEDGAYAQSSDWFSKARAIFEKLGSPEGQALSAAFGSGADMLGAFKVAASGQKARRSKRSADPFAVIQSQLELTVAKARDNHLPRARAYVELRRAQALLLSLLARAGKEEPGGAFEALSGKALDLANTFASLKDAFGAALARAMAGLALSNVDKDIPRAVELLKISSDELGRASIDILSGLLMLNLEKVYSRTGDTFSAESSRKAAEALGVSTVARFDTK